MIDRYRLDHHLNNGETEWVMCAANYHDDGIEHYHQPFNIATGYVIGGWRHGNCGMVYMATNPNATCWDDCVQGFLTTKNRFLDRKEALELVKHTGQLKNEIMGGMLTSEDLW